MSVTHGLQNFQEDSGISFRGLFVIDKEGKLRQITVNDLPVGRDVEETLRLVQVKISLAAGFRSPMYRVTHRVGPKLPLTS